MHVIKHKFAVSEVIDRSSKSANNVNVVIDKSLADEGGFISRITRRCAPALANSKSMT
jgi:hypothetical protein